MGIVHVLIWLGLTIQGMTEQPARLHMVVTDGQGAAVAGAKVTVRNDATRLERSTTSNERGEASLTHLPAGHYTVTVEYPGMGKFVRRLELPVGSTLATEADVRMTTHSQPWCCDDSYELPSALASQPGDSVLNPPLDLPVGADGPSTVRMTPR